MRDYGYDGQIGSEPTPQAFLESLWECTREWVRVLKPEGSLWVNLGDKYSGAGRGNNTGDRLTNPPETRASRYDQLNRRQHVGLDVAPPKSLLGLPWRYALGCIDHLGLILRAEVVWSKKNSLPESVNDRVRRSHEQWFWLTRWAPDTPPPPELIRAVLREVAAGTITIEEGERILSADMRSHDAWLHFVQQPRYYSAVDEIREPHHEGPNTHSRGPNGNRRAYTSSRGDGRGFDHPHGRQYNPLGKLPGSVWEVPSEPLRVPDHLGVDHFAAFPTAWPKRIIQGWSPPGICTACGHGRRPVVDKRLVGVWHDKPPQDTRYSGHEDAHRNNRKRVDDVMMRTFGSTEATITGYVCACTPYTDHPGTGRGHKRTGDTMLDGEGWASTNELGGSYQNYQRVGPWREYHIDGWTPPPTRPAVVLDPMGGTGTTALAAKALGRVGVTVDLSDDYCRLARWRTNDRNELAKILGVPKPPKQIPGQVDLFGEIA